MSGDDRGMGGVGMGVGPPDSYTRGTHNRTGGPINTYRPIDATSMNDAVKSTKKRSKHADFFRACSFLRPYLRIVAISVISAFFVGVVFSGGLGAMLPILRVLINQDTLKGWMDRQVLESKIGVTLADNESGQIIRIDSGGPAAGAGVRMNELVSDPTNAAYANAIDVGGKRITARPVAWYKLRAQRVANLFPRDREWGAVKTIAIIFLAVAALGA